MSRCRCSGRASSGATLLLFANAFGAIATAYALTGSSLQHRHHPALRADPRRRAARPESRLRAGARHDPDHRPVERRLHLAAPAQRAVAAMRQSRLGAWLAIVVGSLYFLVPLIATFEFSLRMRRGEYSFDAYRVVLADPQFPGHLRLLDPDRAGHDRRRHPPGRADRLLDPAAPAAPAAAGRVHHPAAAGDPGHRHRLRLSAALQQLLVPADDRERARDRPAADLRLRHAGLALHVPRGRHRPARDRRAHPDRGRRDPRCQPADHPVPGDPAQHARRHPQRRLPHLRHRDRRVHPGEPAQPAGLRSLPAADRRQPRL